MLRRIAQLVTIPIAYALVPPKLIAIQLRNGVLRRVILECTSFVDWCLVFANVQNHAMLQAQRVFRGNFVFGKAVMIVDHAQAEHEIALPTLRGNRFMGVDLVSNDPGAFMTNAGPITTGQPMRRLARGYIDDVVMNPGVRAHNLDSIARECAAELAEWSHAADMATMLSIRGAVTRLTLRVLAGKTPSRAETDEITFAYTRRFVEFSVLGRYAPFMLGVLGTREGIRRDAFLPLKRLGIDPMVIDMTLFAAMFSIGTIVITCVRIAREELIDYRTLDREQRRRFVIEALRLHPTVTTVHRIVETAETVRVRDFDVELGPGSEIAYPFVCANRDPRVFAEPERFRLDRSPEEQERVLSWSKGPHACPAKELSILLTIVMLDALAQRFDLRTLAIFNLEF